MRFQGGQVERAQRSHGGSPAGAEKYYVPRQAGPPPGARGAAGTSLSLEAEQLVLRAMTGAAKQRGGGTGGVGGCSSRLQLREPHALGGSRRPSSLQQAPLLAFAMLVRGHLRELQPALADDAWAKRSSERSGPSAPTVPVTGVPAALAVWLLDLGPARA